jgi:undecaprenyl-diphosphatase
VSDVLGYGDAIVLGIVEGLTEFLPVSSTGHLTVTEGLLGLEVDDPAVTAFTAIIQFGAIVATFLYFRQDFLRLAKAWGQGLIRQLYGRQLRRKGNPAMAEMVLRDDPDYRFSWCVIVGAVPVGVVALIFKDLITGPLRNLWVVAFALIGWCVVIYLGESRGTQRVEEHQLTIRQALLIGAAQCASLVPGVSRSGSTIAAGMMMGVTRVAATRLSFFLAIPVLTGAGVVELGEIDTSVVGWGPLLVGTVVSFVVAYASIAWLLKFVSSHPITAFIPYRIFAGFAVIALLLTGTVEAA